MPEPTLFTLDTPHPDIEHGRPRQPLNYLLTMPDSGLNGETGVILVINGYGSTPDDAYDTMLRRYLACRYNCLAVGVFYFGCRLHSARYARFRPTPDFFINLQKHHGITVEASAILDPDLLVRGLLGTLARSGLRALDLSCRLHREFQGEYESFGLLPALDCLQVLGDVLGRFPLNRRRLFAFGSSMGGYIALMAAKLAPMTFALVVESSGFVRADDLGRYRYQVARGVLNGVEVRSRDDTPWDDDPASSHTFDVHHRLIRDLTWPEHWRDTPTVRCLFHSSGDDLIPVSDKTIYATLAARYGSVIYHRIEPEDVDGVVFKSLDHGMKASLRHLFDRAWQEHANLSGVFPPGKTDFCCGNKLIFPCGRHDYQVDFSLTGGPKARLLAVGRNGR